MSMMNAAKLVYRTMSLKMRGVNSSHTRDYDAAAATYDEYYSRHLGREARQFMDAFPLRPGMKVLDLACGTGFFSHVLAERVGSEGRVTAVDLSPGMLARNRENAMAKGLTNIRFVEGDAIGILGGLDERSMDAVICGWGVCYMDHAKFRAGVERVLRPGGFVAVIENRACTLKDVSDLFRKVLLRHPDAIVKNMAINLPRDHRCLERSLCRGRLRKSSARNGAVTVPCRTGAEIAEYMLRSGASAGFLDALDRGMHDVIMNEFIELADQRFRRQVPVSVTHEYCTLIARH